MISSYLQGGCGNFCFQIAAAQALAWDLGVDAGFDFGFANQVHNDIRSYQDNILRGVKLINSCGGLTKYHEPKFSYTPLPKIDNQLLIGYFQSEKYFKRHRDKILQLFRSPTPDVDITIAEWVDENNITIKDCCSIHVRRGDYLQLSQHHPPLTMDYYHNAMEHINADKYLIFTDDKPWCKTNFIGDKFIIVENQPDYIDLLLMSLCGNNIIANSSFSWWGAWLNENVNKKVIAPKTWFGPAKAKFDTSDIVPNEWIKI